MLLLADSSGLHGLSESPKFSCSKALPWEAPLDKTNDCLEHIPPTGQDDSLFSIITVKQKQSIGTSVFLAGFLQPATAGVKKIVPRRPSMRDTFSQK
jgi:hypothetical protein